MGIRAVGGGFRCHINQKRAPHVSHTQSPGTFGSGSCLYSLNRICGTRERAFRLCGYDRRVAVVGPIPSEAILALGDSTSTAEAVFEIRAELDPDQPGEEWSSLPAMRVVILDDGTRTLEEAKPEHFTAVRWTIATPLASEQTVANTYRVEVR